MPPTRALLPIIKSALLPEAVYRQLKTAILTGVFRPGEALRQEDVAQRLGVSRGPLREALPKLEAEGMVVSMPHRGCVVASLAPDEIAEIFELRAMLEGSLARAAAQHRDAETVAALRALSARMRKLADADSQEDRMRWFEHNYELHTMLLAVAGRKHHQRVWEMVRALAEPYVRMEIKLTGNLLEAQGEHERLIDAFAAGDGEILESLARVHVQHTAKRLLEALRRTAPAEQPGAAA
jgi:DNA-binding GntR family transcriptional regulator